MIDWDKIKHFIPEEFDDIDYLGSHVLMEPQTIIALDELRERTGWPIITHNKFGLHGCVSVDSVGHSPTSLHYPPQCSAVDWHFKTDISSRIQAMEVMKSGFTGIGVYYDWKWNNKKLAIGFHTDCRKRPQIWKRENGQYYYLLR